MIISRQVVRLLRDLYYVCVLILSTGAFFTVFVTTDDPAVTQQGSPVFKLAWGAVYLISLLRIIPHRQIAVRAVRNNKPLAFLFLLIGASLLWSIDRVATAHAVAILIGTCFFVLDLCLNCTVKKQLQLVWVALMTTVALSVMFELLLPGFVPGMEAEGTAWHGVFGFKNDFGKVICLTVVASLALSRRSFALKTIIVAGGVALAVLSKSASAVGYVLLMSLVFNLWSISKWRPKPRKFGVLAVAVVTLLTAYIVEENFAKITAMMDKDPHMTGRVELWQLALGNIRQQPLLGHGFQAFWSSKSEPALVIRRRVNWPTAPHSHEGYIDLSLSLGLVGLTIYLALCWTVAKAGYQYYLGGPESYRKWPLSYLAFTLIYQLTEGTQVAGNALLWIVFSGLAISLVASNRERATEHSSNLLSATAA